MNHNERKWTLLHVGLAIEDSCPACLEAFEPCLSHNSQRRLGSHCAYGCTCQDRFSYVESRFDLHWQRISRLRSELQRDRERFAVDLST